MTRAAAIAVGLVLAVACATARPSSGAFASSWTPQRCQVLLDQRDTLVWSAAFAGGLSGVGGLTTAIPDDERREWRLGLGISAAVLAAAATSFVVLGRAKSAEFEIWCNQEPPATSSGEPAPEELLDGGVNE